MPHWNLHRPASSVVYIHGIGNQRREPDLKVEWDHALYTWDLGDVSSMAYWADIRNGSPLEAGAAELTGELESDEPMELDPMATPADVVELGLADIPPTDVGQSDEAVSFATSLLAEVVAAEVVANRSSTVDTEAVDPTGLVPGFIRTRVFKATTRLLIPDAYAYFFDKAQGELIRDRLRARLQDAEEPILLIAHSLGSMVAYDVLHEPEFAQLQVAAFITFGSQLGVRAIQDHIRRPLEVPASVQHGWHNYLDEHDPSPLGQLISVFYRPRVISDHWAGNPSPSDHDATSYLSDPRLQEAAYRAFPRPAGA